MGILERSLGALVKRLSWVYFLKVILTLAVLVYAASISVMSTSYQAEMGSTVKVANGLIATDKGFSPAATGSTANGASCPTSPITFGPSPGTANTTITAGDLVYTVRINSTTSAPASTTFNVTLVLASTTYGPLCIRTTSSPVAGQTIDCKFDVGTALPASPYSFRVTVQ